MGAKFFYSFPELSSSYFSEIRLIIRLSVITKQCKHKRKYIYYLISMYYSFIITKELLFVVNN